MIMPPLWRPGGLEKKVALINTRMALLAHGINQGCNTFFLT